VLESVAVTEPPLEVVPLPVGVEPSVGPVSPLFVDVVDVSDGLAVGDDDGLDEGVVCPDFLSLAEEAGVPLGDVAGVALPQPVGLVFGLGDLAAVAVPVGLALTVGLGLEVGVVVPLGVIVGLGLSLGLAGGVVVDGLGDGLLVVGVDDGLTFGVALADVLGVGEGEHDVTGAGMTPAAPVLVRFPPADSEGPADGVGVDPFDEEVASLKADVATEISPARNGGTAASTTPSANTVTPMARAGRSMTSLQFMGRRGACRRWAAEPARAGAADRPDHPCCQYLPSGAKNPAIASRNAAILDWLA
jgi:hypothetical protein